MKATLNYIGKHLIRLVLLLLGVSMLSFFLVLKAPIDPVDAYAGAETNLSAEQRDNIRKYWGLDQSPVSRYFIWLSNLMKGDMGESMTYRHPVSTVLGERFLSSLALMGTSWLLSGLLGFTFGMLSGKRPGSWYDKLIRGFCYVMTATPVFWIGMVFLMIFSIQLGWFPLGLSAPIGKAAENVTLLDRIYHLILPAITLSITGIANITLHTRQKLIEIFNSDYIIFARARGESERSILRRHGLRNIAIPAITLQFASFSELFGGSVLAEQVFSYPGLGNAITQAGLNGDVPLLLGGALFAALFVFAGNMIANVLYGLINPQIRGGMVL